MTNGWKHALIGAIVTTVSLCAPQAFAKHFIHPTEGYSLDYPASWDEVCLGSQLSLTKGTGFQHGGILNASTANIIVLVLPPATDEYTYLDKLAEGSTEVVRTSRLDPPPAQLSHTFEVAPGVSYRSTTRMIRVGGKLLVATLNYRVGDANAAFHQLALVQITSSITVP